MKLGATRTVTLHGLTGCLVDVEAAVTESLPRVTITGSADARVVEGKERLVAALTSVGVGASQYRITINLAPAAVRKSGTGLDLAMAVAVLVALGRLPASARSGVHLGELGLDGRILPVTGVLPAARTAARAGIDRVVVPRRNLREARLVPGPTYVAVGHLRELVALYTGADEPADAPDEQEAPPEAVRQRDLADVVGQPQARFALEVAAAGAHHLFLLGPPGAGKTMLAERLPGLLPPLRPEEAIDVTSIASLMGRLPAAAGLVTRPPFEAVHQGISLQALVGGGSGRPQPGALTAAHHGVLFIDEAPQLGGAALNAMRQPLETGVIAVGRVDAKTTYPARFQLVLAANPCPCGSASEKGLDCTCSSRTRRDYLARLSKPLLDRVDIQLQVPRVTRAQLGGPAGEPSAVVAKRVLRARLAQEDRWRTIVGAGRPVNAQIDGAVLRRAPFALGPPVIAPLDRALERGLLTLRGYDRTLRLAWTVADLDGRGTPTLDDVATALTLRTSIEAAA